MNHLFESVFASFALVALGASCVEGSDPRADDYLTQQMQQRRIPGLSLAVVRDGKVLKEQAYGFANLELRALATTNTVFEIGSITKQFTAALVMMLVQSGAVCLEDELKQHLTDVPASWDGITIRRLLTHTSGLKNYTGLDGFEVRSKLDRARFIRRLAEEPLEFKPGETYSYCNSAYNLLGYLIEQKHPSSSSTGGLPVSGVYWHVLREQILAPLGMEATRSRDTKAIILNRADGYELADGKLVKRDCDLTDVFAAGAMVSTVGDLVKWDAALNTDRLLKASSRDELWQPAALKGGKTYPYGLGWRLNDYKGRRNIGHSGSTSGFSASLQRFPDDRLTVIVLCNLGEQGLATTLAREVADLYFASSDAPPSPAK